MGCYMARRRAGREVSPAPPVDPTEPPYTLTLFEGVLTVSWGELQTANVTLTLYEDDLLVETIGPTSYDPGPCAVPFEHFAGEGYEYYAFVIPEGFEPGHQTNTLWP